MRHALTLLLVLAAACGGERRVATDQSGGPVYGPGSPDPSGRLFGSPPRFEDYPAEERFRGPPAAPDLASDPMAEHMRNALLRAARAGPNFAGSYTLVSRSCGRLCREFVVMDARTGHVYPGLSDAPPFEFRLDSRLIAFEAPEPLPGRIPCAGCSAAYAVWQDDHLELIPPELWVGSAPPPPAVRALVDRVRAEERDLVNNRPNVVRPTWDRLVISARDGSRQVLADRLDGDAIVKVHAYRGYIEPIDAHLVEIIEFEGGRYLLVDAASAFMTEIDGAPVVSPGGARFITASLDLVAGHLPNRVRIYRLTPNGPVVEWSLEPVGWGVADPVWVDDSTIRFERVTVDTGTRPFSWFRSAARLQRSDDNWVVGIVPR